MGLDTTMAESAIDAGFGAHRRTGRVTLVVLCGGIRDLRYDLKMRESTIGRHSQCTLSVPCDDVSREHAKITRDVDGIAKIVDLESTNGTYVNHHRVDVEVLREGDRIQVGRLASIDVRYEYIDVRGGQHANFVLAQQSKGPSSQRDEDLAELARLDINLGIRQEHLGDDHPAVAALIHDIGQCHLQLGDYARAFSAFERALEIYRAQSTPCPEMAHTLVSQGECRLRQGTVKLAIRPLRTGLEMLECRSASGLEMATGRYVLAQTMMDLDLSREQAVESANLARHGFADGGEATRHKFIEVDRWIRKLDTSSDTRLSAGSASKNKPPAAKRIKSTG